MIALLKSLRRRYSSCALWLGRFALGWPRVKTGALRHVEAEYRGEVLATETLAGGRRLLPERHCLARAGEQRNSKPGW